MTPEERDRLTRLETIVEAQRDELSEVKDTLAGMNAKLDQLIATTNMGKGAWLAILKIGGVGFVLVSGAAWVYDRFIGGVSPHP